MQVQLKGIKSNSNESFAEKIKILQKVYVESQIKRANRNLKHK